MNPRIGLFFGSFNPIHLGHTSIALYILNQQLVDWIWFIVSPHNPLKSSIEIAAFEHRLNMTRIAIRQLPSTIVSNVESVLQKPSYTIHTLDYLRRIYKTTRFSMIVGLDNIESLQKWKNWQEILKKYQIIAYPRHYHSATISHQNILYVTDVPLFEVSSSEIRQRLQRSEDVSSMLDPTVHQYILQYNLYR